MRRRMIYQNKPQPTPITDLTGTKWYFNEILYGLSSSFLLYLDFISNYKNYVELSGGYVYINRLYYKTSHITIISGELVYNRGWEDEKWRTIEITGGDDVKNEVAIQWLQENATQIL